MALSWNHHEFLRNVRNVIYIDSVTILTMKRSDEAQRIHLKKLKYRIIKNGYNLLVLYIIVHIIKFNSGETVSLLE